MSENARIAELEAERDRAQRAAQTLGAIVDRLCMDVLDATGLHHPIRTNADVPAGCVVAALARHDTTGEHRIVLRSTTVYPTTEAAAGPLREMQAHRDGRDWAVYTLTRLRDEGVPS